MNKITLLGEDSEPKTCEPDTYSAQVTMKIKKVEKADELSLNLEESCVPSKEAIQEYPVSNKQPTVSQISTKNTEKSEDSNIKLGIT